MDDSMPDNADPLGTAILPIRIPTSPPHFDLGLEDKESHKGEAPDFKEEERVKAEKPDFEVVHELTADLERPTGSDDTDDVQSRALFLAEDPEFRRAVQEGGFNASASVDRWAVKRVNMFRQACGESIDTPFEDLAPAPMVQLLIGFFERVCKLDGSMYPSQTIMGFFRAFHRILRKKQESRIIQSGVDEPVFNLRESPIFKPVVISCVLAMNRSRKGGANVPRKQVHIISQEEEAIVFSHSVTSITYPRGLQRRIIVMVLLRYGVRGGSELYNLQLADFQVCSDETETYVKFDERVSKNYKVTMSSYQEEHFRPPVLVYDPDVIESFQCYFRHMPHTVHMFTQSIDSPRTVSWFSTLRLSQKRLSGILKECFDECGLDHDKLSNKSGRTTLITRMTAEGVPMKVGMQITGHKSESAYQRYDRSKEVQVRAAHGAARTGTNYLTARDVETEHMKAAVIEGGAVEATAGAMQETDRGAKKRKAAEAREAREALLRRSRLGSARVGDTEFLDTLEGRLAEEAALSDGITYEVTTQKGRNISEGTVS